MEQGDGGREPTIRGMLGRALAAGLTVAAATAIVAVLFDSFDETDARIIGTSLGFTFFSATGAAGAAAREYGHGGQRATGTATAVLSAAAFAALVVAIWAGDNNDELWQVWGVLAVAALAGSHASLVLRARRPSEGDAIRALVTTSVVAAAVDASMAIAAIAEVVTDISDAAARFAAVAAIVLVLTSLLPPILRRLSPATSEPPRQPDLASEVIAVTGRIIATNPDPQIRQECERLRETARTAGRAG